MQLRKNLINANFQSHQPSVYILTRRNAMTKQMKNMNSGCEALKLRGNKAITHLVDFKANHGNGELGQKRRRESKKRSRKKGRCEGNVSSVGE